MVSYANDRQRQPLAGTIGKRMRSIAWLLLIGMCWLAPRHAAFALDSQAVFESNEHAVFQIRVVNRETGKKSAIGSGFVFDRPERLATNYHVVSSFAEKPDLYELRYLRPDGSEGMLRLLAVDVVYDLALVEADQSLGSPLPVGAPPAKGAALYAMGNPLDLGLTIAAGTNGGLLSQTDDSRILFSGSLNPGMSGGPTFDERGLVVGINVSTARNDISFIVPARYLQALTAMPPVPTDRLLEHIARQVRAYQTRYQSAIADGNWPTTRLRTAQVPGAISPTIRCWDASPKPKPENLYHHLSITCQNEIDIFLSDRLDVGKIIYEFIWIESESLEPLRFYRLYRALNNSQFGGQANKDDVSNFTCNTQFVDVNGRDLKATTCTRHYLNYPGLSDVLFTAAMVGEPDTGFIFNIDLSGTDVGIANRLITRFLREIKWQR
ncbi:MAG: trypsin-like peptidase domain-containing protein [Chromatiaceae bacterium]|nr:trypsin-like peptidase domain-containing protein [Chromatiaceae bacterium]MCP5314430.1 trypsin-like peptidase domain-containing protein [Chromatiaceae bacterium]